MSESDSNLTLSEVPSASNKNSPNFMYLRDLDVTDFLNICIGPETREQWENILNDFWVKFNTVSAHGSVSEFDVACLFVLDYVYYNVSVSLPALSRSLFAYQNRNILLENTPSLYSTKKAEFYEQLPLFTDLYSYKQLKAMLVDITLDSIVTGNRGLAHFLIKFGLVKFPYDDDGKSVKISETLLMHGLNGFPDNVRKAIHLEELIDRMNKSDISYRSVIILFYVLVFAEYEMHERNGTMEQHMKKMFYQNLVCLDLFAESTMETDIMLRDIETFVEMFLKPLLSEEYCACLKIMAFTLYDNKDSFYNASSLIDLARGAVRQSLNRDMALPELVNQLIVPKSLKDYLLFNCENIWVYFKRYLVNHKVQKTDISVLLERMVLQGL